MIKLCALWQKKSKNGDTYFSGSMGDAKVLIFKNAKKRKPNAPDYFLYVDSKQKGEDKSQQKQDTSIPF